MSVSLPSVSLEETRYKILFTSVNHTDLMTFISMNSYIEEFLLKRESLATKYPGYLEITEIFDTSEVLILSLGLLIYYLFGN